VIREKFYNSWMKVMVRRAIRNAEMQLAKPCSRRRPRRVPKDNQNRVVQAFIMVKSIAKCYMRFSVMLGSSVANPQDPLCECHERMACSWPRAGEDGGVTYCVIALPFQKVGTPAHWGQLLPRPRH
jgi:hypothetical protein